MWLCFLLTGCGNIEKSEVDIQETTEKDTAIIYQEEKEITEGELEESILTTPTKEEVLAMRNICLNGMSEEDIIRLTENIKVANLALEHAYIYDNIFQRLSDSDDLYWNYVDFKGEILIGYAFEDGEEYDESSGLTYDEYANEYGQQVLTYNRYDAENFILLMGEMRDLLNEENLKEDFNIMITYMNNAKETHDVQYVEKIYQILHDMDYYLLRYAPEDVAPYVSDKSTISKYYGVLKAYNLDLKETEISTE